MVAFVIKGLVIANVVWAGLENVVKEVCTCSWEEIIMPYMGHVFLKG